MKHLIWAFLFLSHSSTVAAQHDGYTLKVSPWSNHGFEICPAAKGNALRPVIFEPKIEEWHYKTQGPPRTKLVFSENGIQEIVVKDERKSTAYYLIEQKVGYLDLQDNWVDETGHNIKSFDQLKIISGEKAQPDVKTNFEKFVYKAELELERAAAMEKIHYEAPCTVFSLEHYDKLETELHYDFGPNNPYKCDAESGLKRSQKLNYTEIYHRPIGTMPDGSSIYIKYPDGNIKTYPWYGFEFLYNKDGSLICQWNDLGSIIGYELTQGNE